MKKLIALSLALLLLIALAACGAAPAAPQAPTEAPETPEAVTDIGGLKTVTVSTVEELAAAIGNDTRIILKAGRYNLSELNNAELTNRNLEYDTYSDEYSNDIFAYRISGVSDLSIEAEPDAEVEIVTEVATAPVLYFEYCSDIVVRDLLCGHAVEPGYCTGGVIEADNCKNVSIEACRLYGSGTFGVEGYSCKGVSIKDTQIYECTYGIVNFSQTSNITIKGSELFNNTGYNMLSFFQCWDVSVEECSIHDNVGEGGYSLFLAHDGSTDILFSNCVFADNYPELKTDDPDYVSFKGCTISSSAK